MRIRVFETSRSCCAWRCRLRTLHNIANISEWRSGKDIERQVKKGSRHQVVICYFEVNVMMTCLAFLTLRTSKQLQDAKTWRFVRNTILLGTESWQCLNRCIYNLWPVLTIIWLVGNNMKQLQFQLCQLYPTALGRLLDLLDRHCPCFLAGDSLRLLPLVEPWPKLIGMPSSLGTLMVIRLP